MVGLAAALDQETFTRVVTETVDDLAPGAAGEILTDALRHGSASARRESGETAVIAGFLAAMIAGATAMAQVERGANRLYGVERDRPFLHKYGVATVLAFSAGVGALLSLVVLVGGEAIREHVGWDEGLDDVWAIAALAARARARRSRRSRCCSSSRRGGGSPTGRGSRSARPYRRSCGSRSWAC